MINYIWIVGIVCVNWNSNKKQWKSTQSLKVNKQHRYQYTNNYTVDFIILISIYKFKYVICCYKVVKPVTKLILICQM